MKLAVDIVVFTLRSARLHVLLVERGIQPFKGRWAIPGGFVLDGEDLEAAARRELREETGVVHAFLEQLYTFGAPKRDPRGRVISVAYYALVSSSLLPIEGATDAARAEWFPVDETPRLAFDHDEILRVALERIRGKLDYTNIGFELLPEKFTLTDLQKVHEAILGEPLEKRNFRRKILARKLVKPLKEWRREGVSRPAQLFQFKRFPTFKVHPGDRVKTAKLVKSILDEK